MTKVVHHNPYYGEVFDRHFPIKVLKRYAWGHSLGHGERLQDRFAKGRRKPFIIHAAEGTDSESAREIDELDRLGLLRSNSVIVHGVALSPQNIQRLFEVDASVIWCPASNLRLNGKKAPINRLKGRLRLGLASPAELLDMVTTNIASIFGDSKRLKGGCGTLREGSPADLLLLPDRGESVAEAVLATAPTEVALVFVDGRPRLADATLASRLELGDENALVQGVSKWVYGDLGALKRRIKQVVPQEILSRNPLWDMVVPYRKDARRQA